MNVYDSLTEWLSDNYLTQTDTDWLDFNVINNEPNNVSVMSEDLGVESIEYNDGSRQITLPFQVAMIKHYDVNQSDVNIEAMAKATEFIDWMRSQEDIANYPYLGDNVIVEELIVENEVPEFLVSSDETLANYLIKCKIVYIKEK
jgi:hypothetical protein